MPTMPGQDSPYRDLLLALKPGPVPRDAIAAYRGSCGMPPDGWFASRARLHMTVFKVSAVHVDRLPELHRLLCAHRMERSDLQVRIPKRAAHVPSLTVKVPRAWKSFRDGLGQALVASGFSVGGGDSPHITLSYNFTPVRPRQPFPDIPWTATELLLIWSQLKPDFDWERHVLLERYAALEPAQFCLFA